MTRRKRIALELLGPALIGSLLLLGFAVARGVVAAGAEQKLPEFNLQSFLLLGWVILAAYLLASIPSMVYMVVMEWNFKRGLDPGSWRAVVWSSCLGMLSGGAMVVCMSGARWDFVPYLSFGGLGLAVGFLLGVLIKRLTRSTAVTALK